jgi:hypothetical protein
MRGVLVSTRRLPKRDGAHTWVANITEPFGCEPNALSAIHLKSDHHNVGSLDLSRLGGANQPRLGRKEPNMIIIGVDYRSNPHYSRKVTE